MLIISRIILNSLKYWYARDDKFYSAIPKSPGFLSLKKRQLRELAARDG